MNARRLKFALSAALAAAALGSGAPAGAAVYLNELTVQGDERVELYNNSGAPVNLGGWKISSTGEYVLPPLTVIPANGYLVVDPPGDLILDSGTIAELIDSVGETRDAVSFGQGGSAPLPPDLPPGFARGPGDVSLARAPDASLGSVPPPSPATDGLVWTLDLTPTFGAVNDAPVPSLGSTLRLNEFDPKPAGGLDMFELYNPSALPVLIAGWFVTNGDAFQVLGGSVPGGGHLSITTDPGFDIETYNLLYLFDAAGVRVDQAGFESPPVMPASAPSLDSCQCYARYRDGTGPSLGYDWPSSGGESSLFRLRCTPGGANAFEAECVATSVGEGPGDRPRRSWSTLRARLAREP